jgi:hypothetical protein
MIVLLGRTSDLPTSLFAMQSRMIGSAEAASDRIDFRIVRFNILLRQRRISSKALTDPVPSGW